MHFRKRAILYNKQPSNHAWLLTEWRRVINKCNNPKYNVITVCHQGPVSIWRCLTSTWFPITNVRRSLYRLINGNTIPGKTVFILKQGPASLHIGDRGCQYNLWPVIQNVEVFFIESNQFSFATDGERLILHRTRNIHKSAKSFSIFIPSKKWYGTWGRNHLNENYNH